MSSVKHGRFPAVFLLALAFATGLHGCGKSGADSAWKRQGNEPIQIVCTTSMVADLVKNVGGDQVSVTALMGEGVDPHLYQSSPNDATKLNDARMVFYSGLHLEANLVKPLESMSPKKPVYAITEELLRWQHDKLIKTGNDSYDPHVWFDVMLWKQMARFVADRLGDYDPANQETYARNARVYMHKLDELNEYCQNELNKIPEKQRVLVTAHDAFHYFGKAYGIQVKAIQGVSTETEASVKSVEKLITFMVENNVKAVFVESSVPDDNIKQLVDGCRKKRHDVKRGGELFSDAMGKEGTEEGTYIGMIRHNVQTIVKALK